MQNLEVGSSSDVGSDKPAEGFAPAIAPPPVVAAADKGLALNVAQA